MTSRASLRMNLNARPRRPLLRSRGGKLAFGLSLIAGLVVAEVWLPPAIGEPILLAIRWLLAGAATFMLGSVVWLRNAGSALADDEAAVAGLGEAALTRADTKLPWWMVLTIAPLAALLLWRAVAETLAALG